MENSESPTPLSSPTDSSIRTSPFHPRNLFDLFFRPRRFFKDLHTIEHYPYIYLSAWLCGTVFAFPFAEASASAANTLLIND
jgi:hypothetical protein